MKPLIASVVSIHAGDHDDLHKGTLDEVEVDLEGFPGDGHRGFTRVAWQGDKDPEGTVRRNERQWSGVSSEELALISERMDLARPLEASTLGANLCVTGIPGFSHLPSGTRLLFPSGVRTGCTLSSTSSHSPFGSNVTGSMFSTGVPA